MGSVWNWAEILRVHSGAPLELVRGWGALHIRDVDSDWLYPRDPADFWKDNETLAREAIASMQELLIMAIRMSPRDMLIKMRAEYARSGNLELLEVIDRELGLTEEERRKW